MKRKSLKRTGLLLALLMIFSLLPTGTLSALAEEPAEEIISAALSLTLPQPGPTGVGAGQPVPASASAASGGFSVQSAQWFTSSGSTPTRFEAGEQYYAVILLAPAEGYTFADGCEVSIDTAMVNSTAREDDKLRVTTGNITLEGESGAYPVWVAGVRVSEENKNDVLGDGKVRYDPATATLTLEGAKLSDYESATGAVILAQDLELTVKGSATVESEDAPLGIYSLNGSLKLDGKFTLKTGGAALFADQDLSMEDGSVTAESVQKDAPCMHVKGNITVKKGQLALTGPGAGILCEGSFTMEEEAVVKATATAIDCDSELTQYGLSAESVVVKGGDLTAKGYTGGIAAAKGLSVIAGVVTAEGKNYGILVSEGSLEIQDGIQRVTADGEGEDGAILASSISLGDKVGVKEPADGKVGNDGKHITEADGSSIAKHAVIESDARRFTVHFDTMGGSQVADQTVLEGKPARQPADPTLAPFDFDGWYLDPSGSEAPYDFSTPVTADLTLKARWVATVMASVKDSEGNEGTGGTVSLGGGSYEPSLSARIWRESGLYQVSCKADEGYTFDHWEDGLGKVLPYGESSFSVRSQEGPQVFVAVFMKDEPGYTVTLDANGGKPESLTIQTDKDGYLDPEELELVEISFTREGHDLVGWSLTPGGKPLNLETYAFSKDETLYALWSARYYTVSFETDGGSAVPAQSVAYGKTAYEPDDPYKAGSSFEGWYADPQLTQPFSFTTPITKDTVLYAKWDQVVKYTVVSGGGTIYGKTSGDELVITVRRTPRDGECFRHFTGVRIDNGPLILGTDYTASEGPNGGTVVTLLPSYLSTLNSGSHIITITFDDGKATTGLTVKAGAGGSKRGAGAKGDSPDTGDPGSPMLWTGLLFASAMGLGAVALSGRKLRRAAER